MIYSSIDDSFNLSIDAILNLSLDFSLLCSLTMKMKIPKIASIKHQPKVGDKNSIWFPNVGENQWQGGFGKGIITLSHVTLGLMEHAMNASPSEGASKSMETMSLGIFVY